MVTMETTRAFFDWGRWVADCAYCTSAAILDRGQQTMRCAAPPIGCGRISRIEWPDDIETVMRELAGLPEPQQNWRPAGE